MSRYACVRTSTGRVFDVNEWDGNTATWTPPVDCTMVQSNTANIGDTWTGSAFTPGAGPVLDPLDTDGQRLYDYMPISGSATAAAISAYIQNTANPSEIRVTMATLRSMIRKLWSQRST